MELYVETSSANDLKPSCEINLCSLLIHSTWIDGMFRWLKIENHREMKDENGFYFTKYINSQYHNSVDANVVLHQALDMKIRKRDTF